MLLGFSIWTIIAGIIIAWLFISYATGQEPYISSIAQLLLFAFLIYIFLPFIVLAAVIYFIGCCIFKKEC